MFDLELNIATFNRTMGNRFYVPRGVKEYLENIRAEENREIYKYHENTDKWSIQHAQRENKSTRQNSSMLTTLKKMKKNRYYQKE